MNEYSFSDDWVTPRISIWKQVLLKLKNKNQFLEVGSHEGRSAIWFIENGLDSNGEITCIDSWICSIKHEETFDLNIDLCLKTNLTKKVIKLKGFSYFHLASLITQKKEFDLIYIDGSHKSRDVIIDACLSWNLLKLNGILIFDDYLLLTKDDYAKPAIDLFVDMFKENIKYLYIGDQLIIQKVKLQF
jgi:predicted O-methyltransferase YrrM